MAVGNITKRSVSSLSVPANGKNFLWDGRLSGFGVFVTPSGHRSYVLQYRVEGRSPTKRFTIGRHGSPWTPKQAREKAYLLLWQIAQGIDPMEEKKTARAGLEANENLRLENYKDTFIRDHIEARGLRTARDFDQIMRDFVLPLLGNRLITEISKKDIIGLLRKVSEHSKSSANRTFDWLRTFMNFARRNSDIERSPLDGLLKPHNIPQRERVLAEQELQRLWEAATDIGFPGGPFAKMLVITGLRHEEARGGEWEEFDFEKNVWIIPGQRTKSKMPHLVPLTASMIELLNAYWPPEPRRGLLFRNDDGTRPSGSHMKRHLDAAIATRMRFAAQAAHEECVGMPHFVFHDLRRTLATRMQRLGIPAEHTEAVLNHRTGTVSKLDVSIVKVYQLWKYEPEKRRALAKWDRFLKGLMSRSDAWPGGKTLV